MPSTVKSGNWSDSTVWDTGRPPINGESVTVFTGHTLNVDMNLSSYSFASLSINGGATLNIPASTTSSVLFSYINNSGSIIIGSPSDYQTNPM